MTDDIKPALSKEQWKDALRDRAGMAAAIRKAWGDDTARENDHALAALALIYQPFGFTREDVEWVRARCDDVDDVRIPGESLAARMADLLPPEEEK